MYEFKYFTYIVRAKYLCTLRSPQIPCTDQQAVPQPPRHCVVKMKCVYLGPRATPAPLVSEDLIKDMEHSLRPGTTSTVTLHRGNVRCICRTSLAYLFGLTSNGQQTPIDSFIDIPSTDDTQQDVNRWQTSIQPLTCFKRPTCPCDCQTATDVLSCWF